MHANDIAFGIELETTMPANAPTPIGGYHNGLPVAWLPAGWKAERDSSIRTLAPGRKGCEFVSPVLRGYEGLQNVMTAVDAIAARGGRVNHSTGIHVTVTFNGDAANKTAGRNGSKTTETRTPPSDAANQTATTC
ncbi:amidoligase family protein [Crateriforma conspicua]|uniref:Putative amidoligase enzyme n=1 Tax=Crateriforma conspicua TaxID=2527996 RepID=A0A5C5Y788_9PLAN|nr:amidoligase family protein [Crateriforma conspicua]TWT71536.1 putative amidoligase enzyme [Crateriforma conspicua]